MRWVFLILLVSCLSAALFADATATDTSAASLDALSSSQDAGAATPLTAEVSFITGTYIKQLNTLIASKQQQITTLTTQVSTLKSGSADANTIANTQSLLQIAQDQLAVLQLELQSANARLSAETYLASEDQQVQTFLAGASAAAEQNAINDALADAVGAMAAAGSAAPSTGASARRDASSGSDSSSGSTSTSSSTTSGS